MNKLICPFCGDELAMDYTGVMYCCNQNCGKSADWYGSKILWQALTDSMEEHDLCHDALVERTKELDSTRRTLDVAVDALKKITEECYDTTDVLLYANKALEQITALEQKDKR